MASSIEDLAMFYANLPSIFESDPSNPIKQMSNADGTNADNENIYQPMFGSFLVSDTEPFTQAAFIASTSPPNEVQSVEEQRTVENSRPEENLTKPILISSSFPIMDDNQIDDNDDEDDFDGIPIRQTSALIKTMHNGGNNIDRKYFGYNDTVNKIVHHLENNDSNKNNNVAIDIADDDDDEPYFNGFTDEKEQHDIRLIPSLFEDIPDIDDPNGHVDDAENEDPFDHMDMLDQSNSIRSSSPDSLLSSSHQRDSDNDDYDEEQINRNNDDNDDVAQWNDDFMLERKSLEKPLLPSLVNLNVQPHDQVSFIDSSRSNSRCSNASSHLSMGYNDEPKIFINDDELDTSSESEYDRDENNNENINYENENEDAEEPSLQVTLDYHRSRSTSSHSSFSESSSDEEQSISHFIDQSPIANIDEEPFERKVIQPAPIAVDDIGDIDDDNDENFEIPSSTQPILPIIEFRDVLETKIKHRQNEIAHDIIDLRHLLNERENDDEFIAIMHNPSIFEEILNNNINDNEQKSDFINQINSADSDILQTSLQLSNNNKNKNETERKSSDHYQYIQEASSLSISNNEKNSCSNIRTTNNLSPTAVNHLLVEEKKEENSGIINNTSVKQKDEQQSEEKNITTNIYRRQITDGENEQKENSQMFSSDDESDNDIELLNTLAQLHGLVHTPRLSSEFHKIIDETNKLNRNIEENINENINFIHSISNDDEKQNSNQLTYLNSIHEKEENTINKNEGKYSLTCLSLTSSTSAELFNDNISHSTDSIHDCDPSFSLTMSISETNDLIPPSNQLINDNVKMINAKSDVNNILECTKKDSNDKSIHMLLTDEESVLKFDINECIHKEYNDEEKQIISFVTDFISNSIQIAIDEISQSYEQLNNYLNQDILKLTHLPDDSTLLDSSNTNHDEENLFLISMTSDSLHLSDILMTSSLTTSVTDLNTDECCLRQDDIILQKDKSNTKNNEEIINNSNDISSNENNGKHSEVQSAKVNNENDSSITDSDDDQSINSENIFEKKSSPTDFNVFASDQPLQDSITKTSKTEKENKFDDSFGDHFVKTVDAIRSARTDNDEPWELEESGEEREKSLQTLSSKEKHSTNNSVSNNQNSKTQVEQDSEKSSDDDEEENYDKYFNNAQKPSAKEDKKIPLEKSLRFDENSPDVVNLTPKDSLEQSPASSSRTASDLENNNQYEQDKFQITTDRISDFMNQTETKQRDKMQVQQSKTTSEPNIEIPLAEDEDLPPPLPSLPPLNVKKSDNSTDNIPAKSNSTTTPSSNTDLKRKEISNSDLTLATTNQTKIDTNFHGETDKNAARLFDSGIVIFQ